MITELVLRSGGSLYKVEYLPKSINVKTKNTQKNENDDDDDDLNGSIRSVLIAV